MKNTLELNLDEGQSLTVHLRLTLSLPQGLRACCPICQEGSFRVCMVVSFSSFPTFLKEHLLESCFLTMKAKIASLLSLCLETLDAVFLI